MSQKSRSVIAHAVCLTVCYILIILSVSLYGQPSLSPQPDILILYGENTAGSQALTAVSGALDNLSPVQVYDTCKVLTNDSGIIAALNRGIDSNPGTPVSLTNYCQVWDIRFAVNSGSSGTTAFDTVTVSGISNDQQLYEEYLSNCGALFLGLENEMFYSRNENATMMLNDWSSSGTVSNPMISGTFTGWTNFPPDSLNFATTPNLLTNLTAAVTGYIPLTGTGSARPLVTGEPGGADGAVLIGFLAEDLTTGKGRVIVAYDYNGFLQFNPVANRAAIQNAYTWLGNCQSCVIPPAVTLDPAGSFTTNTAFILHIAVDRDSGYWSTNSGADWNTITAAAPDDINITAATSIIYYGEDTFGNNSGTNTNTYTFDTVPSGRVYIYETNTAVYIKAAHTFSGIATNTVPACDPPAVYYTTNSSDFIFIESNISWHVDINTSNYNDGPGQFIFRAVSKSNHTNYYTNNVIIDNSPPVMADYSSFFNFYFYKSENIGLADSDPHSGISNQYILLVSDSGTTNINSSLTQIDPADYVNGDYTLIVNSVNGAGLVNTVTLPVHILNLEPDIKVGPNPVVLDKNIFIKGLTLDSTVNIYNVTGFPVKSCNDILNTSLKQGFTPGNIAWNLKNNDGYPVAPGLYIIIISDPALKQDYLYKLLVKRR